MAKFRIDPKGIQEILNSIEIQRELEDVGRAIVEDLGPEYVSEVYDYGQRKRNRKVVVVKDPRDGALHREAATGALARAAKKKRT